MKRYLLLLHDFEKVYALIVVLLVILLLLLAPPHTSGAGYADRSADSDGNPFGNGDVYRYTNAIANGDAFADAE